MAALTATGIAAGAVFSGTNLLKGIARLVKFFTMVDDAKTEEDLRETFRGCGGDALRGCSIRPRKAGKSKNRVSTRNSY